MRYLSTVPGKKISKIGLGTWQFGSREWGYGDRYADDVAQAIVRRALELGVTLFDTAEIYGFGRSERILGQALGLGTYKLRFGHRGVNQPVQDLRSGRVQITSHNHGFAVAMPPGGPAASFGTEFGPAEVTHVNLNDGVVEGVRLRDAPAFAVQYHPEAAPGPHDASPLFREFCSLMERGR